MSLLKYSDYQESGVSWIGDVPKSWSISPLKYLADFVNGCVFKPDSWSESGVPIIRIENLNGSLNFNFFDGSVDERHHVEEGDLLFGWSGNRGTSFGPFLWKMPGHFFLNQHIFKVRPLHGDSKWLYWCLKAVTAHVEDQATGIIGMVHVTKGDLGAIKAPVPSFHEKVAIATFLDRETAKIDALIAEQEKLIALLAEKRQSTISRAVTRGLDPNVPLKDSGVPWLGKVPAHWSTGILSRVAERIVVGIAEAATHAYRESGVPILRSTNVRAGRLIGELLYIAPEFAAERGSKLISAGDLVTVRTGNAGVTAVVPSELDKCQCFTMLITTLLPGQHSSYYCYWMNSAPAVRYFQLEGWGTAQVNISVPILKNLPVVIPPMEDQVAISNYLDGELRRLDSLVEKSKNAISLLQERRAALISAAVTGKIDVRGLAA